RGPLVRCRYRSPAPPACAALSTRGAVFPGRSRGVRSLQGHAMTLSTRLTMAMVGLVLFAIAVTVVLTYRNLLDVAVPRALQRRGGDLELVAAELHAVGSAARADVLAFAVEQMVNGGSGEIADASSVFAAAERRQLTSRFAAELAAKPWYDEWRIVNAEDG